MRTRILLLAVVGVTLALAAAPAHATTLFATTLDNRLGQFDSGSPNSLGPLYPITGLQQGESIVAMDFRPATGQLYALGSNDRLYTLNTGTGAATLVGQLDMALAGSNFGFDFNPVTDLARVISDFDENALISPVTAYVTPGPNVTYGTMQNPVVTGSAYSNNFAGATSTNLYGIDTAANTLVMQNETSGQLSTIGPLNVDPSDIIGFDIGRDGSAFFLSGPFLHGVDLTTGNAPSLGMTSEFFATLAIMPSTGSGGQPPGTGGGPAPPGTGGDFDLNGTVDAADFVIFRAGLNVSPDGASVPVQAPDGLGATDRVAYEQWRMNFGQPVGGGSAGAAQRRRAAVLVKARRRVTLGAGERKRVRLPLTRAGKRFIRGYKKRRLKVTLRFTVRHLPAAGAVTRRNFQRRATLRVKRKRR